MSLFDTAVSSHLMAERINGGHFELAPGNYMNVVLEACANVVDKQIFHCQMDAQILCEGDCISAERGLKT